MAKFVSRIIIIIILTFEGSNILKGAFRKTRNKRVAGSLVVVGVARGEHFLFDLQATKRSKVFVGANQEQQALVHSQVSYQQSLVDKNNT